MKTPLAGPLKFSRDLSRELAGVGTMGIPRKPRLALDRSAPHSPISRFIRRRSRFRAKASFNRRFSPGLR
jgi:hypothetical protein